MKYFLVIFSLFIFLSCSDSKECKVGEYTASCNSDGKRVFCDDGKIKTKTCDNDQECKAGVCQAKSIPCNEGALPKCDGDNLLTCDGTKYVAKACSDDLGLAGSTCKEDPVLGGGCHLPVQYQEDMPCEEHYFKALCAKNLSISCSDRSRIKHGPIRSFEDEHKGMGCTGKHHCAIVDNQPLCTQSCEKEGITCHRSPKYKNKVYIKACKKDDSGELVVVSKEGRHYDSHKMLFKGDAYRCEAESWDSKPVLERTANCPVGYEARLGRFAPDYCISKTERCDSFFKRQCVTLKDDQNNSHKGVLECIKDNHRSYKFYKAFHFESETQTCEEDRMGREDLVHKKWGKCSEDEKTKANSEGFFGTVCHNRDTEKDGYRCTSDGYRFFITATQSFRMDYNQVSCARGSHHQILKCDGVNEKPLPSVVCPANQHCVNSMNRSQANCFDKCEDSDIDKFRCRHREFEYKTSTNGPSAELTRTSRLLYHQYAFLYFLNMEGDKVSFSGLERCTRYTNDRGQTLNTWLPVDEGYTDSHFSFNSSVHDLSKLDKYPTCQGTNPSAGLAVDAKFTEKCKDDEYLEIVNYKYLIKRYSEHRARTYSNSQFVCQQKCDENSQPTCTDDNTAVRRCSKGFSQLQLCGIGRVCTNHRGFSECEEGEDECTENEFKDKPVCSYSGIQVDCVKDNAGVWRIKYKKRLPTTGNKFKQCVRNGGEWELQETECKNGSTYIPDADECSFAICDNDQQQCIQSGGSDTAISCDHAKYKYETCQSDGVMTTNACKMVYDGATEQTSAKCVVTCEQIDGKPTSVGSCSTDTELSDYKVKIDRCMKYNNETEYSKKQWYICSKNENFKCALSQVPDGVDAIAAPMCVADREY